ncbi:hypothetical protein CcaverHIS002_0410990 [Cutaneotrichosporon cavernicola]|uniref:Transcription initiation factor IIF subunit beta n=1 Tax=Cutaneotrichosporon cavernicola TaxID=279322 RepID=A0AA48L5E7_9TREE|nr:uncharacterized protein CcaverHIS019_0410900 [Cutaneotrichosporon cavernicola]BEI84495.1 hypothetical protein CcaverHIS002_0410990 [Cutaneotrichosporon cavernicola]BEI92270.1 hypothetical protein CcaverHIS019_0410900 [Cutaneotrichosporon cavernicola]BEJ00042.1 hypothetical protein CcaverHIS631_0410840 [Cutaneotrichosporon cavernicola]BEJ07814.1 hypothetical protein CcaverHIS641_0410830 [Cutaneotrichosporon cavernicola]
MSVKTEDIKPLVSVDGHDVFNIPVEEEELDVAPSHGQSKIWAMKIPRFLLERWERVKEEGVHLGSLIIDNSTLPPKITLKLPTEDDKQPPNKRARLNVEGIPDEYEVVMPSERVKNTYIFSENERVWVAQPGSGEDSQRRKHQKANPRLIGALDHEASVRPVKSSKYLKILEQRRLDNENSKRPIIQLDDKTMSQAKLNQLASGFANASSKLGKGMIMGSAKVGSGERFARMERKELNQRLFQLFGEKPYWSITALKATLQQPDTWLREVLKDVAVLNREGQYANMWELKDNWKDAEGDTKPTVDDVDKAEDDSDEEEESDDEDELEQVDV